MTVTATAVITVDGIDVPTKGGAGVQVAPSGRVSVGAGVDVCGASAASDEHPPNNTATNMLTIKYNKILIFISSPRSEGLHY